MLLPVAAANNINLFHSDDKTTIYNIDFIVGFIKNNDLMQVSRSEKSSGISLMTSTDPILWTYSSSSAQALPSGPMLCAPFWPHP